jgi:predicted Zn-dependent protease
MPRSTDRIDALRAQLGGARDGALLRYSLGAALLETGDTAEAIVQLRAAIGFDTAYSAAWKLLGRACLQSGDRQAAADAWRHGIATAETRGDVQAAKEMRVFLKRIVP